MTQSSLKARIVLTLNEPWLQETFEEISERSKKRKSKEVCAILGDGVIVHAAQPLLQ